MMKPKPTTKSKTTRSSNTRFNYLRRLNRTSKATTTTKWSASSNAMNPDELRDVFAAFALMGLLSAHGKQPGIGGLNIAKDAFEIADQMMEIRHEDNVGKHQRPRDD